LLETFTASSLYKFIAVLLYCIVLYCIVGLVIVVNKVLVSLTNKQQMSRIDNG